MQSNKVKALKDRRCALMNELNIIDEQLKQEPDVNLTQLQFVVDDIQDYEKIEDQLRVFDCFGSAYSIAINTTSCYIIFPTNRLTMHTVAERINQLYDMLDGKLIVIVAHKDVSHELTCNGYNSALFDALESRRAIKFVFTKYTMDTGQKRLVMPIKNLKDDIETMIKSRI